MIRFQPRESARALPAVQVVALIDVLFVLLSFFMSMFLHMNFESQLGISVPQSSSSVEAKEAFQEVVINIQRDGAVVVNQRRISVGQLAALLKKTSDLYPNQAVVLRADQKTYHQHVVRVLDTCAKAKIWNISFATVKEGA